jgi:NTE family protein
VEWVAKLWAEIENNDIYRTDLVSLIPKSVSWLKDLSLGGMIGGGHAHSLLDSTPLQGFLAKYIKTEHIQQNIDQGNLRSVCISTTNYSSGKNFLFIQAEPGHKMWTKSRRVALAAKIEIEHVCASAAIPIVFAPVKVKTEFGTDYFGDGCLRLHAPLSPVIRLGAERILAIGLRSEKSAAMDENTPLTPGMAKKEPSPPPLAQILGVSLNAIFLDHLDADVEHLFRLNQIISQGHLDFRGIQEPIKIVNPLVISPSFDIGKLAEEFSHKLPTAVHYFMSGLGTNKASSSDLISYLLFDS